MGRTAIDLDADEIVDAALVILREEGLDAVSMRTVSAALGVSPVPLYRRVGNKDDLLAAMAQRLLGDIAPRRRAREDWRAYARRWTFALVAALDSTRDLRRIVGGGTREPFVAASRPLVEAMRAAGFATDEAVQATRLLVWTAVGHVMVGEGRTDDGQPRRSSKRPGGDPSPLSRKEADALFRIHVDYVLDGIARAHGGK
ncbi:MAG: TetR family transcriptional regulator [Acidimicrobiia bacterium]